MLGSLELAEQSKIANICSKNFSSGIRAYKSVTNLRISFNPRTSSFGLGYFIHDPQSVWQAHELAVLAAN